MISDVGMPSVVRMDEKRTNVAKEVLETERKYVWNLKVLKTVIQAGTERFDATTVRLMIYFLYCLGD